MTELIKSRILPQNQGQPILSYSYPFRKHITVLRSLECKVDKISETINHSVEKSQKLIVANLSGNTERLLSKILFTYIFPYLSMYRSIK